MKPQVGVVVLHPQAVAITAELPGRTNASFVAEVRPQVAGIVQKRLFEEGGEVKAGDPLYLIDPASYQAVLDSAVATRSKAEAAVPSAEAKVERYQTLAKQNAVAKQDLDDAVATLAQAKAAVAVAAADEATARINLEHTRITAPISGRIDKSTLTPGALVTASQTTALTTIRTLEPIYVDITQSSRRLLDLRQAIEAGRVKIAGDNVKVRLRLENGALYPLPGRLAFSEANVSETTGTYALRAEFPNPDRVLLPGMYVRATVEEGVAENSWLVPQRAVTRNTKGQPIAYFVSADDKIEERVLEIATEIGNNWLITKGLSDGDRVVVEGLQNARAGREVQPVEVTIDENSGEVRERRQGALSSPVVVARDGGDVVRAE
ncbi:MAG: efflux RND transporter periplasmic adaptor subunit [Phyllobacteriaceae bacterium]|nr:efflux RND transporter periplasmic adaptor subunit [Phyllobacteriaceae bacterium]